MAPPLTYRFITSSNGALTSWDWIYRNGSETIFEVKWSASQSVVFNSLWSQGLYSPWNSPGQNTRVGSHSLLQGIFPSQGSNPDLPRCGQILYQLSHQGSQNNLQPSGFHLFPIRAMWPVLGHDLPGALPTEFSLGPVGASLWCVGSAPGNSKGRPGLRTRLLVHLCELRPSFICREAASSALHGL